MEIWRDRVAEGPEPDGHYGGVAVADIVGNESTGNLAVSTMYCPSGGGGDLHQHDRERQLFVVARGSLTFDTGRNRFSLGPMEAVLFEPGEPHSTVNETDEGTMVFVVTVSVP